jgi:hypothetical protein
MQDIAQYIDVLIQAPVFCVVIWHIYKQSQFNTQTLESYKKIIEKLIDKK